MTVERNQGSILSIVTPLTLPDGTAYDPGTAYGPSAPDGTVLNDAAKGSFRFTVEVKSAFTGDDGVSYAKGSIAKTYETGTSVENISLTIATVDGVQQPCATILEGLHGAPSSKAHYLLTVYTNKDNVWTAIEWIDVDVFGKPKLT